MPSSSAVVQLSAKGAQDSVISADPNYTVWKSVHSRFSPFATDTEVIELNNVAFNASSTAQISRYGDLVSRITLEITLPPLEFADADVTTASGAVAAGTASAHYVNQVGFAIWENVTLEVGGSTVDDLYSDFAAMYEELAGRPGLRLAESIGKVAYSAECDEDLIEMAGKEQILYVPLPLFFSKYQPATWGLALPIVALSFHDIRIKIKFRSIMECTCVVFKEDGTDPDGIRVDTNEWFLEEGAIPTNSNTAAPLAAADLAVRLLVDYVYLDTAERSAMSSTSHSLLINTSQRQVFNISANTGTKVENRLYFNHPSTSLIWAMRPLNWNTAAGRRRKSIGFKDRYDFSHKVASPGMTYGDMEDPITTAALSLNGHARWGTDTNSKYFRTHVPYTSWRTMPETHVYSYTFALQGHDWQPTSTLNFSRLDNVSLSTTFAPGIEQSEIVCFSESLNLFVVVDGLGGIRWSN